jgi:hypothetical protein
MQELDMNWVTEAWKSIIHASGGFPEDCVKYLKLEQANEEAVSTSGFTLDVPLARLEAAGDVEFVLNMFNVAAASNNKSIGLRDYSVDTVKGTVALSLEISSLDQYLEISSDDLDDDVEDDDEDSEVFDEELEETEDEDEDGDAQPVVNPKKATLKVLVNPEMHKMASRLYGTINPSTNMSTFMEFIKDLDFLLNEYSVTNSNVAQPKGVKEEAFSAFEEALAEVEEAKAFKYKEGRSGLLSALMKSLSGDVGEAITEAWNSKKPEKLNDLMQPVIKKLAGLLKKAETAAEEVVEEPNMTEVPNLYIRRDVLNTENLIRWASDANLPSLVDDMHVTIAHSKTGVDLSEYHASVEGESQNIVFPKTLEENESVRNLVILGVDKKYLTLELNSEETAILKVYHNAVLKAGGSHDFPEYKAHVTLFEIDPENFDVSKVPDMQAYQGPIELGPEVVEPIKELVE